MLSAEIAFPEILKALRPVRNEPIYESRTAKPERRLLR